MIINKGLVDKFLRVSIVFSVFAFAFMLIALFLQFTLWSILLPGLIACAGVIVSFGVQLNKLNNRFGTAQQTLESQLKGEILYPQPGS